MSSKRRLLCCANMSIRRFILLIPLNFFHLARPTTNLLALLPPAYLAFNILDSKTSQADENSTKLLLAYFVVFGFIQFAESLSAGLLRRTIRPSISPKTPTI